MSLALGNEIRKVAAELKEHTQTPHNGAFPFERLELLEARMLKLEQQYRALNARTAKNAKAD